MLGLDLDDVKDWLLTRSDKLYWVFFSIGALFIMAGIFNVGCTKYIFAIPWFVVLGWITLKSKSRWCLFWAVLLCITFGYRLYSFEDNPYIFPVIGTVIDLPNNWYLIDYKDGGHFIRPTDQNEIASSIKSISKVRNERVEVYRVIIGYNMFQPNIGAVVRDINDRSRRFIINDDDALSLLNHSKMELESVGAADHNQIEKLLYANGLVINNADGTVQKEDNSFSSLQTDFGATISNLMYYPIVMVVFSIFGFL
ncbi:hypothetical protein [Photobacterium damselae]|uniref:hypothetical protein n=1 Tax=Photobacterium damselae TaxID=38293 RepID=UPI0010FD893E|nr:hypothetical protein [Photobacterium damselae]TLS88327.1 hypothetical protein FD720_05725 [Photobacterium damselae subsp. damselae]